MIARLLDWLLSPLFDFAGRQLSEDAGHNDAHGDIPAIPAGFRAIHSGSISEGASHYHGY